jgi:zinc protease
MKFIRLLLVFCLFTGFAVAQEYDLDIPYKKFNLKNGLTVIIHEDHKAPVVSVNLWYHVGSKNEPAGKEGFAHLYEHLMFNGSENYNDDFFKALEKVGATGLNGTTNTDRTNYYETVPSNAFEYALWLESDRMGHLTGAIDQEKLDEQRDVVKNEKRESDNQPYSKLQYALFEELFPAGHPYSHSVIGSLETLDKASLEDVHQWYKDYYGPANTVLTIAGDVDTAEAKKLVEKYFGHIPSGPMVDRIKASVPRPDTTKRVVLQDKVQLPFFIKVYTMPEYGHKDANILNIVSDVLSSGRSSRLQKRLVYDDKLALAVFAQAQTMEIAGMFAVIAVPVPGKDLGKIEAIINEEIERFLAEGPTEEELHRIKTARLSGMVRAAEVVGGKSDLLATNMTYLGDPDAYKNMIKDWENATVEQVTAVANDWLKTAALEIVIEPVPSYKNGEDKVDRTALPELGEFPEFTFPEIQEAVLANGLKIKLATRDNLPLVEAVMQFDGGFDSVPASQAGLSTFMTSMLTEGTEKYDSMAFSDQSQLLACNIGAGSSLNMTMVYLSALKKNLEPSFELMSQVVLKPTFPQDMVQMTMQQFMGSFQMEQDNPNALAQRLLPNLIFDAEHPYNKPLTGTGSFLTFSKIKRDDLIAQHAKLFMPNNATLIVAGDVTMEELLPIVEEYYGAWEKGELFETEIPAVENKVNNTVYIVNRPMAEQSIVIAGQIVDEVNSPSYRALGLLTDILGGMFTSRINMNLREDKGWAYGAGTQITYNEGPRIFLAYAPVQTDKTAETMVEIINEINGILGDNPPTEEEMSKAIDSSTLSMPGSLQTIGSIVGTIAVLDQFGTSREEYMQKPAEIRALTSERLLEVGKANIDTEKLVWIVVGDQKKIEASIKELTGKEIVYLDINGKIKEK